MEGHDEPWREWRAALAGERMHHAWILAGRRGLGKASFALAAASELVGGGMAPTAHPDILVLAPLPPGVDEDGKPTKGKRNISVGQVRQMQRRLNSRPTLGARRAVIFDAADDLEKEAFNALLKSLEEPPQGTFFLLVAHRPGRLPATIRSRCRTLRFIEHDNAAIERFIDTQVPGTSREAKVAAIANAAGSPGAALDFIARGLAGAQRLMARIAAQGDPEFALRGALLEEVGQRPERDQLLAVLEAARMVLAANVAQLDRPGQMRTIEAHSAVSRLIAQAPTANFDATALVLEIGGLLASVADPREAVA
jgi:DNA polymerase-3 subunit delta'